MLVSAGLHVLYTLLLWASYQLGEFSQVYPVARGTAPWVVALYERFGWRRTVAAVIGTVGIVIVDPTG